MPGVISRSTCKATLSLTLASIFSDSSISSTGASSEQRIGSTSFGFSDG
jgi:hypothetical protein